VAWIFQPPAEKSKCTNASFGAGVTGSNASGLKTPNQDFRND
jgi:hypothetical protein